jgi:hypothetical protein
VAKVEMITNSSPEDVSGIEITWDVPYPVPLKTGVASWGNAT